MPVGDERRDRGSALESTIEACRTGALVPGLLIIEQFE